MTGRILNRLRVLLAEKAEKEQRNIPLTELRNETGIAWTTLQAWANNKVARFDAPVIMALCDFLECELGDLLVYRREEIK